MRKDGVAQLEILGKEENDQLTELLAVLLPHECWITRGAVRCRILDEFEPWDDVDVITSASQCELEVALASKKLLKRTRLSGFSVNLNSGREIDVWSFERNMGVPCRDLRECLSMFEFNVDAIGVSLNGAIVEDPLGVRHEIENRILRMQYTRGARVGSFSAYVALKAAYLVIRHRFQPESSITSLWNDRLEFDDLSNFARVRLRREVRALRLNRQREEIVRLSAQCPGFASCMAELFEAGEMEEASSKNGEKNK